jgi:putative Holliday junction resolvase
MAQLNGRILALDFGKRRIGLALSDPLGIMVQPLPTLHRKRIREDLAHLKALAREHNVVRFVFGDPKYMSGDESPLSQLVREFATRLEEYSGIPVVYWDERLTSSEAHRYLAEQKLTREEKKGKVDRIAASLILENYLGALAMENPEE